MGKVSLSRIESGEGEEKTSNGEMRNPIGKRVMMRGTPLVAEEALLFPLSFSGMSFGLWRFGEDFFFFIIFLFTFIFSELVVKGQSQTTALETQLQSASSHRLNLACFKTCCEIAKSEMGHGRESHKEGGCLN